MTLSHVELYEALKPTVGEEAAALMAEVVPPAADLARKQDLAETTHVLRAEIAETTHALRAEIAETTHVLRAEITEAKAELSARISQVESKIDASSKDTMRYMLTFFMPVWLGTWATFVAILLKH